MAKRSAATRTRIIASSSYAEGERFRVLLIPIMNDSRTGVAAVLLTGLEESQVSEPLDALRIILLIAVPLASLALAGGSFLIVRRGLWPVVAITATAERIAAGDLRERIDGVEPHDEVGELARTFNHMIERLAETVERERRFTADAAHELRTPLAAMEASVDVTLSRERGAPEYQRALESVRGQTRRLEQLTRELLLLARLDAEVLQEDFEPADLGALLSAVTSSFAEAHPAARVSFTPPDQPVVVRGNSELLARAFGNILDNAVIHGPATGAIEVRLWRTGLETHVTIADDGPGISAELAGRAFHRFRRGDAARTKSGSGLGLAIVDSIVRVHGGRVSIVPATRGTTVEFVFPNA
jgi:signal transduction histidine kinase